MKRVLLIKKGVFVLLLALFAGMGTAYAADFSVVYSGQTLYFNIIDASNHYVEITYPGASLSSPWEGYTKPTGNITLPSTVTHSGVNYTVTAIGSRAFYDCSRLTGSLIIPNTVTTIGGQVFWSCSGFDGSLTIPNSVTVIGNAAFGYCSFSGSLVIPSSVTSIESYTFMGCGGFTSLTIPASVSSIGDVAFAGCEALTSMTVLPETPPTFGEDIYPGANTFSYVPTTIPVYVPCPSLAAYQTAPLWSAFTNILCLEDKLTYSINPDGVSVTVTGHVDGTNATGEIFIPETKTIDGVSYTVTAIGNNAFNGCTGLTGSLPLPHSLISIGGGAFGYCTGFTGTLTIRENVTSIGGSAFKNCSGFTMVRYGATNCADVTSSDKPFEGCGGTLIIVNGVQRIPAYMFYQCSGFTGYLSIPHTVTSIGNNAFNHCTGFTGYLTIGHSVTEIGGYAFNYCTGFTDLILSSPSSITTIGEYAFYNCNGFTGSLTIPSSVVSIGQASFNRCSGFTGTLTIPNSVTYIGTQAFYSCSGFTGTLTIPNSVTYIGNQAFYSCSGFTGSLTIPNSVSYLGNHAFAYCSGFTGSLTIPDSVTSIDIGTFKECNGFTGSLTIPNSVTTIGQDAFYDCHNFTGSLTIGSSVVSMGNWAFARCNGLTSITVLPETPPVLSNYTFQNVSQTIPVYVPCVSLEDYQAASGWSAFTNMQCIPETLTVYDGTATNNRIPAYIFYFDDFTRSQFVIPDADLADMIGSPITSMTFYTESNFPYSTESSADVYLKEVNYTTISAYEPKASATIVYSGYFDIVSNGNSCEMTINFSTPYTYNGGNLLVGVENTEDNYFMNIAFIGRTVNGASISGSNGSSTGTIPATQQNFIPKTTFVYIPSECSRPIDLAATDITINSATLDWTGYQDDYDLRYRKKVYFFEDFENGLPSSWTTIDNDGDGYNWHSTNTTTYSHSGSTIMISYSYDEDNDTGLTPDNWLITPQLDLQGTMKVWLSALHPSWAQEHFAIYLSTTGNSVSDFTTVLVPETTLTDDQYRVYTADLSAYEGQQGYIAIRHFNCTDMYALLVDDFGIFNDPDGTLEWETINDIEPGYILNALEPNTDYEWQVRGRDCDGSDTYTEWSAANSFTTKAIVVDEDHPFTEGFEGTAFAPAYWENYSTGSHQWTRNITSAYVHSGSASAYSYYYGDNYLVMPDLELSANASAAQLTFWSYNLWPGDFTAGNNTVVLLNGGTETELWSAETVSQEWVETTVDLSAYLGQTIRLAFKYAGDNGNGWFVDDVEVSVTPATAFTQTIELNAGWNWISLYVEVEDPIEALQMLEEALGDNAVSISASEIYTEYFGDGFWIGDLDDVGITNEQMYMVEVVNDCEIELEGVVANPADHAITIYPGWNWIGFPSNQELSVEEALAGFEAEDGDQLAEAELFTEYGFGMWIGDVETLVPGQGYMYYSNSSTPKVLSFTQHEYVDLGLPSGLLWATCNLGANAPEDYGDYFAWGETQPKTIYYWSTYQYCNGSENTLTKYCFDASYGYNGFTDNLTTLESMDDAATANWGNGWRMPTSAEWQELYWNTTVIWTTQNGVNGYLFTADNGNSLFLPAAGYRSGSSLYDAGSDGDYWSSSLASSLDTDSPSDAWYYYFDSDIYYMISHWDYRYSGRSVRPVRSARQN